MVRKKKYIVVVHSMFGEKAHLKKRIFKSIVRLQEPNITDQAIEIKLEQQFAVWFLQYTNADDEEDDEFTSSSDSGSEYELE
ncbi:hypothetical protein Syun_023857 [Stephania yunnanensis]|uniref:Uncharacterized protein n=1 Tax=Stephania yunnanensis TaxID=152371 RepID=A0AAP0FAI0_9MAGN